MKKKRLNIYNRIRKYRQYQGMLQKELAEVVGIRPETISRLENNHRLPSLQLAFEIANVLDMKDKINRLFLAEEKL